MSFGINLLRNNSPINSVRKNTQSILNCSGTLKAQSSIIDPVIQFKADLSALKYCNYMYIQEFGRYYFVNDIISIYNDIVEIHAHVDVLRTFGDEILANTGITRRQETQWNLYLQDNVIKAYQNPLVLTREFPTGFSTKEFVLAVAGGS